MYTNFKKNLVFMFCFIVMACAPQTTQSPVVTEVVIDVPTEAPEPETTSVPNIPATPLSSVSMDSRIIASIDAKNPLVANQTKPVYGPEEIVFANGFVWVHMVNGTLAQVNPFTNTISSAVTTDTTTDIYHYCQGLGTDGKDVWVCSASGGEDDKAINVVRVDTTTLSIVATFEIEKIFDQLYMPFAQNQIWVLTGDGSKLVGIDVTTNQTNPAIDLGIRCFNVSARGDALYATCGLENLVIKIDPVKKEIVAQQTLQSPGFIFAGKDGVWVSQTNSVTRLDPESLIPVVTITGITSSDINVTSTAVWVWEYGKGILYKIDPATNEVTELIKPDKPFTSGGGVLYAYDTDTLWLTVDEDDQILRLSLK